MSDISDIYKKLFDIVPSENKQPTIINPDSNFVVVTYWWGAPNQNANIARPCILFYEDCIKDLIKSVVKLLDFMSLSKIKTNRKLLINNISKQMLICT